jgi:hypothetical protein
MSGSSGPTVMSGGAVVDTRVPTDTQAKLMEHWRLYGPNHGEIMPGTIWDDGATTWDDGATIWFE